MWKCFCLYKFHFIFDPTQIEEKKQLRAEHKHLFSTNLLVVCVLCTPDRWMPCAASDFYKRPMLDIAFVYLFIVFFLYVSCIFFVLGICSIACLLLFAIILHLNHHFSFKSNLRANLLLFFLLLLAYLRAGCIFGILQEHHIACKRLKVNILTTWNSSQFVGWMKNSHQWQW